MKEKLSSSIVIASTSACKEPKIDQSIVAWKYIRYWFSALPFAVALKVSISYLFSKKIFPYLNFYFSQTGEDIVLSSIMKKVNGFYIDVGCNDPVKLSNTFLFYLKGWRGITIDANEVLINKHKKIRKYDKAICAAISNEAKQVTFYKSTTSAVSTISEDFYNQHKGVWNYIETQTVKTTTLTSLLDEYLEEGTKIDLLTVDVEGVDFEVLQGLDFKKYRPHVIIIEIHGVPIAAIESSSVHQLLTKNFYRLHGFVIWNAYYIDLGVKQIVN